MKEENSEYESQHGVNLWATVLNEESKGINDSFDAFMADKLEATPSISHQMPSKEDSVLKWASQLKGSIASFGLKKKSEEVPEAKEQE